MLVPFDGWKVIRMSCVDGEASESDRKRAGFLASYMDAMHGPSRKNGPSRLAKSSQHEGL
jgi:hypothetical protein